MMGYIEIDPPAGTDDRAVDEFLDKQEREINEMNKPLPPGEYLFDSVGFDDVGFLESLLGRGYNGDAAKKIIEKMKKRDLFR